MNQISNLASGPMRSSAQSLTSVTGLVKRHESWPTLRYSSVQDGSLSSHAGMLKFLKTTKFWFSKKFVQLAGWLLCAAVRTLGRARHSSALPTVNVSAHLYEPSPELSTTATLLYQRDNVTYPNTIRMSLPASGLDSEFTTIEVSSKHKVNTSTR